MEEYGGRSSMTFIAHFAGLYHEIVVVSKFIIVNKKVANSLQTICQLLGEKRKHWSVGFFPIQNVFFLKFSLHQTN